MGENYLSAYEYIRGLKPFSTPNYDYLLSLFRRVRTVSKEIPCKKTQEKRLSLTVNSNQLNIPTFNTIEDESNSKNMNGTMSLSIFSQKVQADLVNLIF
jgi:hypothetical protein